MQDMNPQDLFRVVLAAAHGNVRDPDLLGSALVCTFVDAELARIDAQEDRAQALLRLQHHALRLLPELRAACGPVDAAAREIVKYQRSRQREDPTYELPAPRPPLRIPSNGIPYRCEACGTIDRISSRKAAIVVPVHWAPNCVGGSIPLVSGHPHGHYRLVVCCRRCRRRKLKRCFDEQFDGFGRRWIRCDELVVGRDYCERHRSPEAERERGSYDQRLRPDTGRRRTPRITRTEDYLLPPSQGRQRQLLALLDSGRLPCLPRPGVSA